MKTIKTADLPKEFLEVNPHNLYLYCKAYASILRANSAQTKNRSAVSGGGKKPWAQKGGGRARAGSIRSPLFRGGGVIFGPSNDKNYNQKVNKKQKKLALMHAMAEHANNGSLFVVDSVLVDSGKTKDAAQFVTDLGVRDVLVVKEMIDDKTYFAFRNLKNAYMVEANELNAYLATAYKAMVIEQAVFDKLTSEV